MSESTYRARCGHVVDYRERCDCEDEGRREAPAPTPKAPAPPDVIDEGDHWLRELCGSVPTGYVDSHGREVYSRWEISFDGGKTWRLK
jgi:hypothetical protein